MNTTAKIFMRQFLSLCTAAFLILTITAYSQTDENGWLTLEVNQSHNGFTYLADGSLLFENVLLAKTSGDRMLISPTSLNGTFILALLVGDKGAFTGYIFNLKTKSVLIKIELSDLTPLWRWVAWSPDENYAVFGGSMIETMASVHLPTKRLRIIPINLWQTYGNNWEEIQLFDLTNFQWLSSSSFSVPVELYCNYYDDPNCSARDSYGNAKIESNIRAMYKVQVNLETNSITTERMEFSPEMIRKQIEFMISDVQSSIEELKKQNLNPSSIEKSLRDAMDALKNENFDIAQSALKEAKSIIGIARNTYSQIQSAKVEIDVAKDIGCDITLAEQKIKTADDALAKGDYSSAVQLAVEATTLARQANCGKVIVQDLRAMATKYDQRTVTIFGEVKSIDPVFGQGYQITLDDGSGIATIRYLESIKDIGIGDEVIVEGTYYMDEDIIYAAKIEHGPFFTLGRIILILLLVGAASAGYYYRSNLLQGIGKLSQTAIILVKKANEEIFPKARNILQTAESGIQKVKSEISAKAKTTQAKPTSKIAIFTSPAGAIIAAICFFLPWLEFNCAGMRGTASGSQLGGLLWIVFISALAILAVFFYFWEKKKLINAKPFILWSSVVGIATLLIRYIAFLNTKEIEYRGEEIPLKYIDYSFQFGAIGTLLGLVLALFGIRYLRSNQVESVPTVKIKSDVFDPSKLTKECPACKEEIKLEAKICRFCHYQFSDEDINEVILLAKQQFEAERKE